MNSREKRFGTPSIKALTFDVFGTVTDWRSSVIGELSELGLAKNIDAGWERFADLWRTGYGAGKERVRRGEFPGQISIAFTGWLLTSS